MPINHSGKIATSFPGSLFSASLSSTIRETLKTRLEKSEAFLIDTKLGQERDMTISQSLASFYRHRLKWHHSLICRRSPSSETEMVSTKEGEKQGIFSRNRRKKNIDRASLEPSEDIWMAYNYGNCEGYPRQIINNYWIRLSHDSDNYRGQCLWYNTNWGLDNYRYHAKTESSNCFIMHIPELSSAMTKLIKLLVSVLGDVTSACIKRLSVAMM